MDEKSRITPEVAEKKAYGYVGKLMASLDKDKVDEESINGLCSLAFNEDKEVSKVVLEPMFGVLINDLKKSFGKKEGDFYLKIFPYFVLEAKKRSELIKKWFDLMGISESDPIKDLYQRSLDLRKEKIPLTKAEREGVKKIIFLSRNTIGAEVLVSGVLLPQLINHFSNSEILFIDSFGESKEFFDHDRITLVNKFIDEGGEEVSLKWKRKDISIIERFEYTARLAEYVSIETKGLSPEEYLVFDADTRLSQTGTMPISKNSHYFIDTVLDSGSEDGVDSLASVCNRYLNKLLGTSEEYYPQVYLSKSNEGIAEKIWGFFGFGSKKVVLVSFTSGVDSKTLSLSFEKQLVSEIVSLGLTPLIERSPDKVEDEKNVELVNYLRESGKRVLELDLNDPNLFEGASEADVYTFKSKIGPLASLIKKSRVVVGYDSKNQHISAALSVPFITVFTGYINQTFLKRWTPKSKNFFKIVEVDKEGQRYYEDLSFREGCEKRALDEVTRSLKDFLLNDF